VLGLCSALYLRKRKEDLSLAGPFYIIRVDDGGGLLGSHCLSSQHAETTKSYAMIADPSAANTITAIGKCQSRFPAESRTRSTAVECMRHLMSK
jgi:hypothetical protein